MASRTVTVAGAAGSVEIQGLRDFARALKLVDERFGSELKEANVEAASELVDSARSRAAMQGGVAAKAAKSLRAARLANAAAVSFGGARYPYAYGAEFGSKRYHQFKPWRGNQFEGWSGGPGYFLFPSLRADGARILRDYFNRVDRLLADAFPD